MREILFRGKRKDNGEWEEGYVFDDNLIGSGKVFVGAVVIENNKLTGTSFCEVIPDTIGQYTGFTDINGTKIFNGDILQNKTGQFCVFWNKRFGNWGLINEKGAECYNLATLVYDTKRPLKVVGNIHDNPEWLKGGAE